MMRIRAILYDVAQLLWLLPFGLIAPLTMLSRPLAVPFALLWIRGNLVLLRVICGIRVRYEGLEHMPDSPAIFASKHQSTLDTYALLNRLHCPSFVLKQSLLKIPVFGWYLWRLSPIAINRKAGSQALKQIHDDGQDRLAHDLPIVIFPEGTRKPVGAEPDYQAAGVFTLYKLGAPLIPVALDTGRYWPKRWLTKYPGTSIIRFLPAIEPGLNKKDFMARLEEVIERETL